jgi:hypothetical protein
MYDKQRFSIVEKIAGIVFISSARINNCLKWQRVATSKISTHMNSHQIKLPFDRSGLLRPE